MKTVVNLFIDFILLYKIISFFEGLAVMLYIKIWSVYFQFTSHRKWRHRMRKILNVKFANDRESRGSQARQWRLVSGPPNFAHVTCRHCLFSIVRQTSQDISSIFIHFEWIWHKETWLTTRKSGLRIRKTPAKNRTDTIFPVYRRLSHAWSSSCQLEMYLLIL